KGSSNWIYLSNSTHPSHKFGSVGTYEIKFTVTDEHGGTDFVIKELVNENLKPTANFTFNPDIAEVNKPVQFNGQATDPENDTIQYKYSYRMKGALNWIQMSNSANPSYTFSTAGTYEIMLVATDEYGDSDMIIK